MKDFVRIGADYLRRDTINKIVIERNCVSDNCILETTTIFIIVHFNEGYPVEYSIRKDERWYAFISSFYQLDNLDNIKKISSSILRSADIRQTIIKETGAIIK